MLTRALHFIKKPIVKIVAIGGALIYWRMRHIDDQYAKLNAAIKEKKTTEPPEEFLFSNYQRNTLFVMRAFSSMKDTYRKLVNWQQVKQAIETKCGLKSIVPRQPLRGATQQTNTSKELIWNSFSHNRVMLEQFNVSAFDGSFFQNRCKLDVQSQLDCIADSGGKALHNQYKPLAQATPLPPNMEEILVTTVALTYLLSHLPVVRMITNYLRPGLPQNPAQGEQLVAQALRL